MIAGFLNVIPFEHFVSQLLAGSKAFVCFFVGGGVGGGPETNSNRSWKIRHLHQKENLILQPVGILRVERERERERERKTTNAVHD